MRWTLLTPALAFSVGASIVLPPRAAAEYSWQISGTWQNAEAGERIDNATSTLEATHFFAPVSEEIGPTALSAFLSRSSSVSLGGYEDEHALTAEVAFVPSTGLPNLVPGVIVGLLPAVTSIAAFDTDAVGTSLTGRHVWRNSGWYVGGGIEKARIKEAWFSRPPDTDVRGHRLFGGKYLGQATSLDLSFESSHTVSDYPLSAACSFLRCVARSNVDADEIEVRAFHVGTVGAMQYAISGAIAWRDGDFAYTEYPTQSLPPPSLFPPLPPAGGTNGGAVFSVPFSVQQNAASVDTYAVGGEIFPTRRLGFSLGYTNVDDDFRSTDDYEVAATWFFVRHVGMRFAIARTTNDRGELRTLNTATAQLIGRF